MSGSTASAMSTPYLATNQRMIAVVAGPPCQRAMTPPSAVIACLGIRYCDATARRSAADGARSSVASLTSRCWASPQRRQLAQGLHRALADRRAKALREAFGHILVRRVVDDLLGLDDFAGDVVQVADLVDQALSQCLFTIPEQTREGLRGLLQARAAPLFHDLDELLMDLVDHRLGEGGLLLVLRRERVEHALVGTGREQAALDAELFHRTGEAEAVH